MQLISNSWTGVMSFLKDKSLCFYLTSCFLHLIEGEDEETSALLS